LKILLFANTDWYLYNFRLTLAKALRREGHQVLLLSPPGMYAERFEKEGFRWIAFPFSRNGINPFIELKTLFRLIRLYRTERPHVAHHFTVKCVLYGAVAARVAGLQATVSAVTGLGHVFTTHSAKTRLLRPMVSMFYRALLRPAHVIFQNPDDRDAFITGELVRAGNTHLIRGSGVNILRFIPVAPEIAVRIEEPMILMIARVLREKGIQEFVSAAGLVRQKRPNARFVVAGEPDPGNPSSFSERELAVWRDDSAVEFLGHVEDVLPLLQGAAMCVLPSYREGTPRSLLEAAACGLPLVATDVPGCREIVRHGENGLLVPPRDVASLAKAIIQLLENPDEMRRMGARSRQIAIEEFSEDKVISETLEVYTKALQQL
jgi:glycosyltransferase involved in cell wall biosynthesis